MKTTKTSFIAAVARAGFLLLAASLLAALTSAFPCLSHAATTSNTAKTFATPEEAVAALRAATASADTNALRDVLGPAYEDLENPDQIQATNELESFSTALSQTSHLDHVSDK